MSQPDPQEHQLFAGKFRMQKMLGRGAMGEVWLAIEEGPRNFSRQVAVKRLLATEGISDMARQSFVAEAQALAHLDHPNIVRLIELGESDDRGLYLVLDYVDGAALDKIIRKTGALSAAAVALIGREVAKALDAVHSLSDAHGRNLGVVHRDVSPANILVGKDGRVRLSDFGVARITGLGGEKTETGVFKGKLPYMPPEQALGEPFDGRADLFSLGITIFEAAIGGRLRKAETQGQLIARIATERAPYVRELVPACPPSLAQAIDSTTEFKSAERMGSAGQLALALHQVLYQLGPGSEEEAIAELRERVATTTQSPLMAARAPWSLALSAENPAYGSNAAQAGGPSAYGAGISASPLAESGSNPIFAQTGPRHYESAPMAAGDVNASYAASAPPGPPTVTHIATIRDAVPATPAPSKPWAWVAGATVAGAMIALAVWFFLGKKEASPTPAAAPTTSVAVAEASAPPANTAAPSSAVTEPTTTTDPSSVAVSTLPSAEASPTSGTPRLPSGKLPTTTSSAVDAGAPGSVLVVVNPWGNVSIDGRSVGTTPIAPVSVPPGMHVVAVTNSELGAARSQTVKVVAGKQSIAKFDLKKSN